MPCLLDFLILEVGTWFATGIGKSSFEFGSYKSCIGSGINPDFVSGYVNGTVILSLARIPFDISETVPLVMDTLIEC